MRKNAIALLLSIALAAGSIGTAPVLAAEEAVAVEDEGNVEEEVPEEIEDSNTGLTVSEEEAVQAAEEEPVEEEQEADESAEEQDESADIAVPEETADVEDVEDSVNEEEISVEVIESEESEIIEEEIEEEGENEAALAGDVVDSGTCGENATWTLTGSEDDLTLTISGSGDMNNITKSNIPWVSKRSKIKTVIVEEGITSIKGDAFYSLNKLTNVSLPNTVTWVSGFEACSSLTSIIIPNSVVNLGTFKDCSSLTDISIPDSVTSLGSFYGCSSLKSIIIPDCVTYIGEKYFYGCSNLESITIGSGVEMFDFDAFNGCNKIKEIHIKSLDSWLGINDCDSYLAGDLYLDDKLLTSVVIPEGHTGIRAHAFNGCHSLKSITIPNSVKYIKEYAFHNCGIEEIHIKDLEAWLSIRDDSYYLKGDLYLNDEPLTNAVIPDSVTKIRENAFEDCSCLKSIILPKSVTAIGGCAFWGCRNLININIPESVTTIGGYAFSGCSSLININIPESVTTIGSYAFSGCSSLNSIVIPDSVSIINEGTFSDCRSLKSITLSNSVSYIGERVIENCENFREIHIKSLESWLNIDESLDTWLVDEEYGYYSQPISYDLYLNDELLTDAIIPDDIIKIRDRAFWNCESLKSVTIPNSVTSIGKSAFFGCSNLSSVMIPDSVTSIGQEAFCGCSSLTSVTIPGNVTDIESSTFESCKSLTSIMIPDSVTSIGSMAFYECGDLTSVTIPESVTRIGDSAFEDCNSLTSITIPDSVTYIGDHAFGNHNTNTSVRFRGTEEQWEAIEKTNGWEIIYYKSIVFNCFNVPVECKLSGISFTYAGKEIRPAVTVSYEGKSLIEGVDYEIVYKNNTKPGTATADVVGTGDYSGIVSLDYDILLGATKKVTCTNVASGIKVSWEKVEGATSYYVYRDDSPWYLFKTSALVVTDKDVKYWNGSKFVYKVVATAKGSGDSPKARTATMYRLMPVGITSLTNPSAGKMTVTYDYCYGGSGYVVRYGLKSDMSDAKVITVKGDSTTSRTFGGMKKGKTYYVQVRTYKIENGVRYYSGYCTTKKITIKK